MSRCLIERHLPAKVQRGATCWTRDPVAGTGRWRWTMFFNPPSGDVWHRAEEFDPLLHPRAYIAGRLRLVRRLFRLDVRRLRDPLPVIDWDPLHRYIASEIECRCGRIFRSHAKGVAIDDRYVTFTEIACPGCGRHDDARRVSSNPEEWSIG